LQKRGTTFKEVKGITGEEDIKRLIRLAGFIDDFEVARIVTEYKNRQGTLFFSNSSQFLIHLFSGETEFGTSIRFFFFFFSNLICSIPEQVLDTIATFLSKVVSWRPPFSLPWGQSMGTRQSKQPATLPLSKASEVSLSSSRPQKLSSSGCRKRGKKEVKLLLNESKKFQ
jgi:hypothetical protein